MTKEDWKVISKLEGDDSILRVNEWVHAGHQRERFLFAVRYFQKRQDVGLREVAYYMPMMQPEGSLVVFKAEGRKWSNMALTNIGLM